MPQNYVGAAGDSTHAYTVQPIIEKAIDTHSRRNSIFGGLGADSEGKEQLVKTMELAGEKYDVGNSSVVQSKVVDVGDEVRFTLQEDFKGIPTHGAAAVKPGDYPEFMHDNVRLNLFDSPEFPFWSEMDQQRFANLIANMEPNYQKNIAYYMAEWIDFLGLQALLHGADRGLLLTTEGGLGMQLMNAASAGDAISCKNTYVGGSGMVTWSAIRATYEASVGHAIYGLTDTLGDYFSLAAHEVILNQIISTLRYKTAEAFGLQLRAVALTDPWLMKRLLARDSTRNEWYTLMRDADVRGPKNHAIDRDQSVIIDKILYIPCDWLRAFRATGADNVQPTYGCALTGDPKVKIETADADSKKCAVIYMGAKALLHASSTKVYGAGTDNKKGGKIWFTPRFGEHGKGGGWSAHCKTGFKRYEPMTKIGGTTRYSNEQTLVAWFYDAGPGVTPGA